jgi:hypothetical protein
VTGLSGKSGGTYLIPAEPGFRLDFPTPLHKAYPDIEVSARLASAV